MGRILVIDDEPSTRVLFKNRLEDLGHEVTLAANGAEGLMSARSNKFDLFLVDIGLGAGVDGVEVCRRLKAVPQTNGVPVVLISGQSTTREDLHRGYNAGCESFLMKGDMTLLEDVLRAMLRIKSLKDDLAVQNYLLERQNRRLQEETRSRPSDGTASDNAGSRGPERPLGVLLVGQDGLVQFADRGARDIFGAGLEGKHLGVLAPSGGLEAFVRDARTETLSGFRLDLSARAGRTKRSLLISVAPTMPRGDSDLGGLKVVTFHDSVGGQDVGVARGASSGLRMDLPLLDAARRVFRPGAIIGSSLRTVKAREALERAIKSTAPVVLQGEAGVGKTFYARCLHFANDRCGPFLHVDAKSLSPSSLVADLFGTKDGIGFAEAANQGTLFISGFQHLPKDAQERLVQLAERGELKPEGSKQTKRVQVRLVVSTRENLDHLEQTRTITADFLGVFEQNRIEIAPLRERIEDAARLAQELAHYISGGSVQLNESDLFSLKAHTWPGNVRELEDCVEVLCAAALGDESGLGSLPDSMRDRGGAYVPVSAPSSSGALGQVELTPAPRSQAAGGYSAAPGHTEPVSLDSYEKMALERALEEAGGDKLAAAKLLNVGKSTLYRKLKRHGIA
ncbi:MAG: sigma 54-interacting transcriptional regulator [Planctomycetota bacterium]|nr:sigma 54-interacting transcriptional regulator [Planctomycetota bacterium]MDG2144403.1 sigma 54-interacting transcriptional regulator [Planctomycetota bacterium]